MLCRHDAVCGPSVWLGGTTWQIANKARHDAVCPSPRGLTWQHLEAAFRSNYTVLGREISKKGEKKGIPVCSFLMIDQQ